jgi:hypothetical protein
MQVITAAPAATVVPFRSREQREQAMQKGNKIRYFRARVVKPALKTQTVGIFDVMDHPLCATMKIRDVLLAIPKMGGTKVDGTLLAAGISWRKTCEGLTQRQRESLAMVMLDRHPHLSYKLRTENAESVLASGSMDA